MRLRRSTGFDWRDHIGGEAALLALLTITGSIITFWLTSRQAEAEIDARTKARLRPNAATSDNAAQVN